MATKLVSMKIDKAAREKMTEPSMVQDGPMYPYGLSINLENESLKKLGAKAGDYEVGQMLVVVAKVEVTNLSSHESKGGESRDSVGLQITEMCLEAEGAKAGDAANALYKG